jgi:hypothetical protein
MSLPATVTVTVALFAQHPIAIYEAREIALDASHQPFGRTGEALRKIGILDREGAMAGPTRDVVLSAIAGDDFDLHLTNPISEEDAPA